MNALAPRGPGDIEALVVSMLRGTAKILGCTSANLLVFNEKTRQVRLRVAAFADSNQALDELEDLFGALREASFVLDDVSDSLVVKAWRDRLPYETSSMAELAGSAFPAELLPQLEDIIGDHRYIAVPAVIGRRRYGVIVFEKPGKQPFSAQQRILLVRYARRITELVENELRDRGMRVPGPGEPLARLLVDRAGRVVGGTNPTLSDLALPPRWADRVAERAGEFLRRGEAPGRLPVALDARVLADVSRVDIRGEELALVTVAEESPRSEAATTQLVQLAMGEAAPALLADADLRITSCNDAAERLFASAPGELIGRSVRELFPEPRQLHVILDQELLSLASGYYEETAILRRLDGSPFAGRVEAMLLADDADHVVGLLVLVRERSDDDEDDPDRQKHRERLASMGELAAQLAHEIRNPLVAVGATLAGLGRELDEGRDVREQVDVLRAQVARVDRILKEYLSLTGRHQSRVGAIDLGALAREAAGLVLSTARSAKHRIECRAPDGLIVLGDAEALRHLLCNLLQNAVDAMPQGGKVACGARAGAGVVSVWVDDRGPGLSCEAAEAFRPFFTTKKNGTGLGLTVCQNVVAAHGGTLDLRNRPGGGCRATVVLPRKVNP